MRKLLVLVSVIVLLVSLTGCSDGAIPSSEAEMRLGSEPSVGGWVYYSDGYTVRRVKPDGTGDEAFTDFYAHFVFTIGEWVYYKDNVNHPEFLPEHSSSYNEPVLYRVKEDGTGREQVCELPVWQVINDGEYIYHTPQHDYGRGLYRAKPDGSDATQIYEETVNGFYFVDGYIYLESFDLMRMNRDGGELTLIVDGSGYSAIGFLGVTFCGDYIYYTADIPGDCYDNKYLYRVKTDGSEITQLTDSYTGDFVVSGSYIYYVRRKAMVEDSYLYRMTLDGDDKQRVCDKRLGENDGLIFDGTYIYLRLIDGAVHDETGYWETSRWYKIECR